MALDADNFERLSAYLDGELSPAERAEIERWLERDAEARSLFNELRQVASIVAALPRERAPADMADAVVARCERAALLGEADFRPRGAAAAARWTRPLALAASLLVVATIAWIGVPFWPEIERSVMQMADMESASEMRPAAESNRGPLALNDAAGRDRESAAAPSDSVARDAASNNLKTHSAGREHASPTSTKDATQDRDGPAPPSVAMHDEARRDFSAAVRERRKLGFDAGQPSPEAVAAHDAGASPAPGRSDMLVAAPAPTRANVQPSEGAAHVVAFGSYTNRDVQSAPISAFGNRVDVAVDDPKVVEQLDGLIRASMEAQAVPDMASAAADETLPADRAYYFRRAEWLSDEHAAHSDDEPRLRDAKLGFADARDDADASEADAGGARAYVLTLQRSQVAPLLASMQTYLESQNVASAWTTNEQPVAPDRAAVETVSQLVAGPPIVMSRVASPEGGGGLRDAERDAVDESKIAVGATRRRSATASDDRAELSDEAKSAESAEAGPTGIQGGGRRGTAKERSKSARAGSSASESEFVGPPEPTATRRAGDGGAGVERQRAIERSTDDAEYVTLAVRLRSDPSLRAQRRIEAFPSGTQPSGKAPPTSQPVVPATTQPATSESPRG